MQNPDVHSRKHNGDTEGRARIRAGSHPPTAITNGRAKGDKMVERGRRTTGRVVRILYGQSHGFIRAVDDRLLFFHRRDVPSARFNLLSVGDAVVFEVIEDKVAGPRAVKVRRANRNKPGRPPGS